MGACREATRPTRAGRKGLTLDTPMTKYGEVEAARNRFPRNGARETIGCSDRRLAEALRGRGEEKEWNRGMRNCSRIRVPRSPPAKSLRLIVRPDCPSRFRAQFPRRDFRRVTTFGKSNGN